MEKETGCHFVNILPQATNDTIGRLTWHFSLQSLNSPVHNEKRLRIIVKQATD